MGNASFSRCLCVLVQALLRDIMCTEGVLLTALLIYAP